MSETTQTATVEKQTKAEEPKEVAFNVDALNQCTARFTRKAWNFFLDARDDLDRIQTERYDIRLEARSPEGAETLRQLLLENETPGVKVQDEKTLAFRSTFAKVQTVIKHEQVYLVSMEKPAKV